MPRRQTRSGRRSSSGGPVKPRQPGTGAAAARGAPARKAAPDRSQEYLALVGSMVVALDRWGRITMVNRRGCDVLGWNEAEVLGRDWFDTCVPERLRGEVRAVFDRLMAGELTPVEYFENPIVRRDGIERIVAWHNTVLRDAAGRPNGTLSAGDDVTERRQAEQSLRESEARYHTLFENSQIGIYRTTPDGRVLFANPTLLRMLGYSSFAQLAERDLEVDGFHPSYPRSEFKARLEAEGSIDGLEAVWFRRDGAEISVREHARCVRDASGKVLYYDGTVENITERKRAEEALRSSEVLHRTLFESATDALFLMDDYRFTECNAATLVVYGCSTPADIIGHAPWEFSPECQPDGSDSHARAVELMNAALGGRPQRFEWLHTRLDGTEFLAEVALNRINLDDRPRLLAAVRDITERRRTEQARQESAKQFRRLFELSPEGVAVHQDGRAVLVNEAAARILGYASPDLLVGLPVMDFVAPEDRALAAGRIQALLRDGKPVALAEERFLRRDGSVVEVEVGAAECTWQGRPAVQVVFQDISARKRAAEALREGEERFRRIVETAHEGIWVMDAECRTTFANRRLADMLGLKPEDVMGRPTEDFLFPEDVAQHSKRMEGRKRGEAGNYELRLRRSDGAECWALVSGTALADAQGGYAGSFAMLSDITIQKRTEVALQQRTDDLTLVNALNAAANRGEKLAGLVELLTRELQRAYGCENVTFYSRDASGRELSGEYRMNPRLRAAIEGLIGGPIPPIRVRLDQPSPYREVLESKMPRLFDTPAAMVELAESFTASPALRLLAEQAVKLTGVRSVLLLPVLSGGSAYGLLEMTGRGAFPSEQVERLGFVASQFMAIVDRKVEEEELAMYRQHLQDAVEARSAELRAAERLVVRAEKLATLGRVAGSVAHELRNPLGAIRNASYYLQKTASDRLDGKHLRHLQIIDEYVGRANNAITAILDFTQGRPTQRVRCALRPIVERAVADAALPQTVDVRLAIDDGLPAVLADDQQMAVVFRNLLINASQAMSGHGRVRVSASAARGRVVVGVADQGVGISREHMARLFEPLFTTKEIGVGLGLAICRAFIEANGGSIKIDSEVGKGTTVRVSLPAAQPEPAAKS